MLTPPVHTGFDVEVVYTDEGCYLLGTDEEVSWLCCSLSHMLTLALWLQVPADRASVEVMEEEEGEECRMQLYGFVGDQRVSASVAVIDNTLHIFSTVRWSWFRNCCEPSILSHLLLSLSRMAADFQWSSLNPPSTPGILRRTWEVLGHQLTPRESTRCGMYIIL